MRQGLSYFHETIFSSLPVFQRRIDTALKNIGQPMLPLEHNLFHFGSWMGGDRDGNPFVTPETTREVVITARLSAVNLYFQQMENLMFDLSTWRCNAELQVLSPSLPSVCWPCCCLQSSYCCIVTDLLHLLTIVCITSLFSDLSVQLDLCAQEECRPFSIAGGSVTCKPDGEVCRPWQSRSPPSRRRTHTCWQRSASARTMQTSGTPSR